MSRMLVAFAGEKTRQRMTEILESAGIHVAASCASGAEILRWCDRLESGVVLCGYKLWDMTAEQLFECLPDSFSIVLLATQMQLEFCREGIVRLQAPAVRSEVVDSVQMLLAQRRESLSSIPIRSQEDQLLIRKAKELLMARNRMTEQQAHRFLQKYSMDNGAKLVQTAEKILDGQLIL